MNISALNNNSASLGGILPPRMKDMMGWWSADSVKLKGGTNDIEIVYDKSGNGNHLNELDSGMSNDFPTFEPIDTTGNTRACKGMNVMHFDGTTGDPQHIRGSSLDLSAAFGTDASPTPDPTWTVAGVVAEGDSSANTEIFISINDASNSSHRLGIMRHNQGRRWSFRGSGGSTSQYDSAVGQWSSAPQSFVFTAIDPDTGTDDSSHTLKMWANGDALTWSDTSDTTYEMAFALETIVADTVYLSFDSSGANDGWFGTIGEMILWAGSFTDAEAELASKYLSVKWGVA